MPNACEASAKVKGDPAIGGTQYYWEAVCNLNLAAPVKETSSGTSFYGTNEKALELARAACPTCPLNPKNQTESK